MSLIKELKKQLIPKKLWVLRLYVGILTTISEILLILYIGFSLYNLVSQKSVMGDFILGAAGLYVVGLCLGLLFVAQIVSLFLNIHDNIEDVRNKTINPDFSIDIEDEKESKVTSNTRNIALIVTILLSIALSINNLNRHPNMQTTSDAIPQLFPEENTGEVLEGGEKNFQEIYPTLKTKLLKTISESNYEISEGNNFLEVRMPPGDEGGGAFLKRWEWDNNSFKKELLDVDESYDYTIELKEITENNTHMVRYSLYSSYPDEFIFEGLKGKGNGLFRSNWTGNSLKIRSKYKIKLRD